MGLNTGCKYNPTSILAFVTEGEEDETDRNFYMRNLYNLFSANP
jgi:hypothetical protein